MLSKQIIAIVGMPGAGKSAASSFFEEKKLPVIRFGEVTTEALKRMGLPMTQENEKPFREKLRAELGMAAFAIKIEPKIHAALKTARTIVLDGMRSWEEFEYLKNKFESVGTQDFVPVHKLAIYASPQIRYQRLKERKERSLEIKESHRRDIAEVINLHMGPPIALADYLIKNETTLEAFHEELEKFLKEIDNK